MKAWDGAARTLELVLTPWRGAGGKHKGGPVQLVFQARGHDADNPFMKIRVNHADGRRRLVVRVYQGFGDGKGLVAHVALDLAPLAVDAVQRLRQFGGTAGVVGQQALNAQGHVRQAAGGVEARAECKAEVEGGGRGCLAP